MDLEDIGLTLPPLSRAQKRRQRKKRKSRAKRDAEQAAQHGRPLQQEQGAAAAHRHAQQEQGGRASGSDDIERKFRRGDPGASMALPRLVMEPAETIGSRASAIADLANISSGLAANGGRGVEGKAASLSSSLYAVERSTNGGVVLDLTKKTSLLQKHLNTDMLHVILPFLDGYDIGRGFALVNKWFSSVAKHPDVWRDCCLHVWKNEDDLRRWLPKYGSSFNQLFIERPRPRFDGLYILEHVYWRAGGLGLVARVKVHHIRYYRVFRFLPNGTVLYALLNDLRGVAASFSKGCQDKKKGVCSGTYRFNSKELATLINCGHMLATMRLSMEERVRGHHDRLQIKEFKGRSLEDDQGDDVISFAPPAQPFCFYPLRQGRLIEYT